MTFCRDGKNVGLFNYVKGKDIIIILKNNLGACEQITRWGNRTRDDYKVGNRIRRDNKVGVELSLAR